MKNRIISLILAISMCMGTALLLSSCGDDKDKAPDALVVMTEELDGLFSPFFSTSGADATIVGMTQIGMLTYGYVDGKVTPAFGDKEAVVAKDFDYDYNEEKDETTYTFVLKNNIKFSDGHPLTMEDVLFNMYVYLDPVYTGSSTMYSTDILGLQAYRTQRYDTSDKVDQQITNDANNRAKQRINELVNLFADVKKANNGEATYAQMKAAIATHSLNPGYKSAISANPSEVTNDQLLADYELALKYFKEELETDYDSAKNAYTEEPYKSREEFKDEITCFMYYEGFVTVEFGEKDGKPNADKSVIKEVKRDGYDPNRIKTKEAAIQYVYDSKINSALDEIVQYWATAQKLSTEYTAKAKEVVLHENQSASSIDNISGIVSLGHTTDVETVTINGNTYKVAHEHDENGVPKSSDSYDVLQITIDGIDPKAVWNFAFSVAPQHYYGDSDKYPVDIENNKFGVAYASFDFMRDVVQSKNSVPMGAGAYVATNANNDSNPRGMDFFSGGVVYFKANNGFLLGEPKTDKIRYQVVSATNALGALKDGSVHYVSPQLTPYNENQLADMKSKGFESIDVKQLGYGYIGINAGKVPNINLRRAIMAAMNTELAISYYSAGKAEKIYWPMSTVSWAYPKDEDAQDNGKNYPQIAYTEEDARELVQQYMDAAGDYDEKDLKITFTIAGANLTDHPTYNVFQSAAKLLNSMGWDIEVLADTNALTKLSTGSLAVWAAAWGTTVDPDMYQVYHKNSTATSVYAWGYREILANPTKYSEENAILTEMSALIDDARETDNQDKRAEYYKDAMGLVLDLAVELPFYQRQVLYAYNTNVIKADSLPSASEVNPYSSPLDRIWEIELVGN